MEQPGTVQPGQIKKIKKPFTVIQKQKTGKFYIYIYIYILLKKKCLKFFNMFEISQKIFIFHGVKWHG